MLSTRSTVSTKTRAAAIAPQTCTSSAASPALPTNALASGATRTGEAPLPPVGYNALVTGRLVVSLPPGVDAAAEDDEGELTPQQIKRLDDLEAALERGRSELAAPLESGPPVPPPELPRIHGETEAYGTKTPCPDVLTARAIAEWIRAHQRADWRIHLAALEEYPAAAVPPQASDVGDDRARRLREGPTASPEASGSSERKALGELAGRVLLVHRYIMERPLKHAHSPAFAAVPIRYVYACWGPALPLVAQP